MSLKKLLLLFVLSVVSLAVTAQVKVTGTVLDENNEGAIGATVAQKNKPGNGVATDMDGKFTLTVPNGAHIVVKYIGYEDYEFTAKAGDIVINLKQAGQSLETVVVTGYQKLDKRLFTGATSSIDGNKANLSGVADVSRGLEGRAAGVQVQNVTGTFGTAPKIRVRGATSIYGSSKPLWVVDGVILEDNVEISADDLSSGDATTLIASAVAGLNADDIEKFEILKDGSATSIYGAQANAGVIVITTKQGRKGHTSLNYTGEFTYRLKPRYADYNISNSQEQMSIYKEMEQKGWLEFASLANGSSSGIYGRMYNLMTQYDPISGTYALPNTRAAMNDYLREAEYRNTDWFDLLFNNNVMQNHALSVSGGTDKGSFYTSVSVMNDPGWYKSSRVERYTFNSNASYQITDKIKIKLLNSDSYRKQKAPGTLSRDIDVVNGEVRRDFDINPYSFALNTARTLDPNAYYRRNYSDFNIFNELDNNYMDIGVTDIKFQGELSIKPIIKQGQSLEFNLLGAYRHTGAETNHYILDNSNQAKAYRAGIDPEDAITRSSNSYLYTDPDVENALPETVLPKGGMLFYSKNSLSQYDFRGTFTYMKNFGSTHMLNLFGGMEAKKVERYRQAFEGWGIVYSNGNIPFTSHKLFKQMEEENGAYFSDSKTFRRSMAYFANANYGFKGRYVVNGTFRYEGSNLMGKTNQSRWLPTWNISGAWNVDEENFFKEFQQNHNYVVSHAKLRASYSLTGESGPMALANAEALYYPSRPWRQETEAKEMGISLNGLANSELTYEKKHELDIGVDLGFLNNRINVEFDWYKRNNYDLIGRIYTEGVGGVSSKYANVAEMASHGVEFTVSTKNIEGARPEDFSWSTDFTFSYSKTNITKLLSRSRIIDLVPGTGFALEGYPHRAIFSIPFAGLDSHGIPQFYGPDGEIMANEDINFQEYENLGFLKYEGPVDPTITGGFGNNLSWKGFHLNVFMTYSFGNKLRITPTFSASYSDMDASAKEFKNRWVMPGDEAYTTIPAIASRRQVYSDTYIGRAYSAYNYSTARIADGGFIRLKEISLTYDIPANFIKKLRLSSASLKLAATNICLLYADKKLNGQDPEFYNSGGVASPNPKQVTFTLRLGF
ncbi:MAG: SusC/RagA family TonB-linked outer membrane protein [Bacteroidales bacterium]|nr:SusC/RagA family TonB-linked outer membrane protein [Candidatus Sodaliphilus limicaballi]